MNKLTKFKETEIGMIPEDWEAGRISDLVHVKAGYAIKSSAFTKYGVGVIKIKNIGDRTVDLINTDKISNNLFNSLSNDLVLSIGDIVIAMTGATIGKVGKIRNTNKKYVLNQRVARFISNNKADLEFVFQFTGTKEWINSINNYANGAAQQNISADALASIPIPIPPENERKAIAKILSDLDDKIELLRNQNKTLEVIGQELFKHWFVDFEFPDEEGKPYKSSGGEMVYSEELEKEIPKGWEAKKLKDTLKYIIGGGWGKNIQNDDYNEGAYVIRGTDIPSISSGNVSKVPYRFHKKSNYTSRRIIENDLILEVSGGSTGQPVGRTLLASRPLIKNFKNKLICASFCKLLRFNEMVSPYYIDLVIKKMYRTNEIMIYQEQSTGISNLKTQFFLENVNALIPPKNVNETINMFFGDIYNKIGKSINQIQILSKTRDLLLPKLMSGKIRVPLEEKG